MTAIKGFSETSMQAPASRASRARDAELLALCDEFAEVHAEYEAAEQELRTQNGPQAAARWEACETTLWPLHASLLEAIIAAPAATLAGAKAKAAVLRLTMAAMLENASDTAALAKAEPHERLAWSLANDLVADLAGETDQQVY